MSKTKVVLTRSEQIDRIRKSEGRTQKWLVDQLSKKGYDMSEAHFSMKKQNDNFSVEELEALVELLPGFTTE